jgi:hypothetical protein
VQIVVSGFLTNKPTWITRFPAVAGKPLMSLVDGYSGFSVLKRVGRYYVSLVIKSRPMKKERLGNEHITAS